LIAARARFSPAAFLYHSVRKCDPEPLARVGLVLQLLGDREELLRALLVVHVRHRQAPVGHRQVPVERGDLAEGALRFEVVEAVELRHALVKNCCASGTFVVTGNATSPMPGMR
jgi:hypothetical protein